MQATSPPWFIRILKRVLTFPVALIAAFIVLLEDWLWDDLQRLAAWFGSLPIFKQIEALILRLPPTGALLLFLVPSLVLIPVKLFALWLLSRGHAVLGIGTVVAAKIAGTALVARLFTLTKPKLLTFNWFRFLYERLVAFKARVYARIKASYVYRATAALVVRVRDRVRTWWLTSVRRASARAESEPGKNRGSRGK